MEIAVHFPNIALDESVMMPDHVHGIIGITDAMVEEAPVVGAPVVGAPVEGAQHAAPLQPGSIPVIVRSYKSAVSKHIHEISGMVGIPVWQRNYWEHIIRNEDELERIRYYIRNNPKNWNAGIVGDGPVN
jgi:putative transposase